MVATSGFALVTGAELGAQAWQRASSGAGFGTVTRAARAGAGVGVVQVLDRGRGWVAKQGGSAPYR